MIKKKCFSGVLSGDKVVVKRSSSNDSVLNYWGNERCVGSLSDEALVLSLSEAFFLLNKGVLTVKGVNGLDGFVEKASELDSRFLLKSSVFSDLRGKGFFSRTGLKYGADFSVYPKGVKPGEGHSKWLVKVFSQNEVFSWSDWVGLVRVAHSVRKKFLVAVVDESSKVSYYECDWVKL